MRATAALVAAVLAFGPLELLAEDGKPTTRSGSSDADREVVEMARRAQALFEALEFEAARAMLEAAVLRLPQLAGSKVRSKARLWMLLGRARAELGDAPGADDAFYEAVTLDHAVRFPRGTSPKIAEALERARRVAPKRGATASAPRRTAPASAATRATPAPPPPPTTARPATTRARPASPAASGAASLLAPPPRTTPVARPGLGDPPAPGSPEPPEWEPIYDEEKERRDAARIAAEATRLADDAGREAEGARKKAESELAKAETARARAEEERRRADGEQAKARSARAETEVLRAGSEMAKIRAEAERVQAEAQRASAEADKAQAEARRARAEAETARAEAAKARAKAEAAKARAEEERRRAELERVTAERRRAEEKKRPPELRHRLTGKLLLGEGVDLSISRAGLAPNTRLRLYVSRDPRRPFVEQPLVRTGSVASARIAMDRPEVRFHVRALLGGRVVGEIGDELEPIVLRTPAEPLGLGDAWSTVDSTSNAVPWSVAPSIPTSTASLANPVAGVEAERAGSRSDAEPGRQNSRRSGTQAGVPLPDVAPEGDSGLLYLGLAGGVVLFLGVAAAVVFAFKGSSDCEAKRGYGCTEVRVSPLVSF